MAKLATCRQAPPDEDQIPRTVRQGTSRTASWTAHATKDFEEWTKHKLYTPYISEKEWRDPNLPYWFVWQFTALGLKKEFAYLNYADIPTPNSYCLIPVLPTEVDPQDYFTLSLDGLTYFKNGCGKFLPITQWLREIVLYRRVGEIHFFNQFLKIYSFRSLWKSAVIRKNSIASAFLDKRYLIASRHFKIIASDIRLLALEIKQVKLVDLAFGYPMTLDQFLEKQSVHIMKLRDTFADINARARNIIATACENAYAASQEIGSLTQAAYSLDSYMTQYVKKNKSDNKKTAKRPSNKPEAVVSDDDAHHYTRLAAIRSCCRRITKFIRACDLQFIQALLECVRASATQFVQFWLSTPAQRCLAVDFMIDHFVPAPDFFFSQVFKAWGELSGTTSVFERFLYSQDFAIYTKESLFKLDKIREPELTQTFRDVLQADQPYQDIIALAEPNVMQVYKELTEITEALVPYLKILAQAKQLKMEFTDDSAAFFQEMITELKGQLEVVDSMPQVLEHRIVEIQLQKMKAVITPAPRGSLEKLRGHVPFLCLTKAQALSQKIEEIVGKLTEECRGVFHFGEQFDLFLAVSNEMNIYRRDFHAVSELYQLLDAESFPIALELTECVRGLGPKYSAFESLMIKIGESKGANARKWGEQLKKEISTLTEAITVSHFQLQGLTDDVEVSLAAILEIDEAGKKYQSDLEKYQSIQRLIGVKMTEVDGLPVFLTDLKNKKSLFTCSHDWTIARLKIMSSQLKDIVANEFTASIDKFKSTSDYVARVFQQSPLAAELKESVTEFSQLAPVIATLRTPSLKERHWKRIEALLQQENLESGDIKIQALVNIGAANYSEEFAQIAVEAENEETLEQMLNDILFEWSDINFVVLQNPDNAQQLVLAGIQEITDALDESLVKCSTIRASRYVGAIKSSVDRTMAALVKVDKTCEIRPQTQ
jgi:dynein heavy chain